MPGGGPAGRQLCRDLDLQYSLVREVMAECGGDGGCLLWVEAGAGLGLLSVQSGNLVKNALFEDRPPLKQRCIIRG